ncbi:MAG: pseudouridine synthase [Eubacteriales bacterium]|nr:pseudouridine synthase [Eubacteriales bacterium]
MNRNDKRRSGSALRQPGGHTRRSAAEGGQPQRAPRPQSSSQQPQKAPQPGGMRLNQYIASCGICSRRDADQLIAQGLVAVNGAPAQPGMRVSGREEITVRGKRLRGEDKKVVVAWYKPVGVTCTARDPHAERTVSDAFFYPVRLTYAGRLDRESEGLLLMTNDGRLIDAMMRASGGHEKEYIVRLRGRISDASLQRLRKGVYLKELDVTTRPCEVARLGESTIRIVLTQGLNHQIRRMCRVVGNEVKTLKRIRVLTVRLNDLQPGEMREIKGEERNALYHAAGL